MGAFKISELIGKGEILKLIAGKLTLQELFNGRLGTFLDERFKEYLRSEKMDAEKGETMNGILIYLDNDEVMLAHLTFDKDNKPVRSIRETPLKKFGDFVEEMITRKAQQANREETVVTKALLTEVIKEESNPEQPQQPAQLVNGTQEKTD